MTPATLTLTRIQRLQLAIMREIISPWGLQTALIMGGKHMALKVWSRRGDQYRLTLVCRPRSDGQSLDHARQNAARLIRRINAEEGL